MHTTHYRKTDSNSYQHVVIGRKIYSNTNGIPDQTTNEQKILPVKLVHLVPHDKPRYGISGRKDCSADKAILCVVYPEINLEVVLWIITLSYVSEEVLLPLCSDVDEEENHKIRDLR